MSFLSHMLLAIASSALLVARLFWLARTFASSGDLGKRGALLTLGFGLKLDKLFTMSFYVT